MSVQTERSRALHVLWIWSDLLIALGLVAAVGTFLSLNEGSGEGLLLVLVSALAGLGYLLGCAIACTVWSARRRWTRVGASALKGVAFVTLLGPSLRAGDYVHLAMYYPAYRRQIEARDVGDATSLRFDWGDKALWVTDGLQSETLVYDPTDALMATVGDVRAAGRGGFGLATRHLVGHFYVELEFSN